ncbi:hypothetical protein GCM10009730_61490 [Streptomyces albidochromogenes]|uniref:Rv1733c family protein n=1 Tax=Streptomyces albidochromogenes TaxID=329524 RepID=UPI00110F8968|nr:hypothetical protein [Streptomyces albidochromogenes]
MLSPVWKCQWREHPLRRRIDIVEAWVRLALAMVLSVGVMTSGAAVVWSVYADGRTVAADQAASWRQVRAEVVREAPQPDASVGETGRADTVRAVVRWAAPDGSHVQGVALVPSGLQRGQGADVWLDGKGRLTQPPLSEQNVVAGAVTLGVFTAVAGVGVAAAAGLVVRSVADRRRLTAWEREWQQVGPGWSHRDA